MSTSEKEATMIYIKIDNDVFYDDAVVLVRSFYPRTEVMALKADSKPEEKDEILSIEVPDVTGLDKKNAHEVFKDSLYKKLSEKTGKKLPWGYLTGVRPSKIAYTMLEEGATKEQIKKHFMDKHYASEEKADLALTVARKELDILTDMDYKTGYSLYIGIPFCPSICLYCSFSSYALDAYKDYVDNYVDALIKEIRFVAESMKGRRLDTVYMGGGTPTTLSAAQLDKVLTVVEEAFDLSRCRELTVEAGRPDSVTPDKFKVLKAHNVGRISINPQTMNQKTLDLIGRKHTVGDIKNAYAMAREAGLNVCSGGIVGLGETMEDRIDLALQERELNVKSIPVNMLNPIKGTPYENNKVLTNDEMCRIVALFRFINPDANIRLAGGRGLLPDKGKKCFMSGANAAISGDMLTTSGITIDYDMKMLKDLGYKVGMLNE